MLFRVTQLDASESTYSLDNKHSATIYICYSFVSSYGVSFQMYHCREMYFEQQFEVTQLNVSKWTNILNRFV